MTPAVPDVPAGFIGPIYKIFLVPNPIDYIEHVVYPAMPSSIFVDGVCCAAERCRLILTTWQLDGERYHVSKPCGHGYVAIYPRVSMEVLDDLITAVNGGELV